MQFSVFRRGDVRRVRCTDVSVEAGLKTRLYRTGDDSPRYTEAQTAIARNNQEEGRSTATLGGSKDPPYRSKSDNVRSLKSAERAVASDGAL